jgi:hypothetical protein
MNRSKLVLGVAAAVSALGVAGERKASACGGCFHPPSQTVTDITDEKMLLAVSGTQTTLYDQIEYSGSPSNFAWVLPIHGTVTVGLSADILFQSIDTLTATQIDPPPTNCPSPNCSYNFGAASGLAGGAAFAAPTAEADAAAVTVLSQENVGPYETVQLKSDDGSALDAWLTQNGYNIPPEVQPILDAYVEEGFDFLAMKLLPNAGVQAMRPVRVSTSGASLSLPLRMASIGTGAVTGITIWVVADGRYEPQNFQYFYIPTSQLVWNFATSSSNYTTLRAQQEANYLNAAWEIESSIDLNETLITNVILSGGQYYGNGLSVSNPVEATADYLPVGDPDAGGGDAGDSGYESADEVRTEDVAALFTGMAGPSVRVTRIRSDIAQTAMTEDFVLQASADQSELSNVRQVTQSINLTCPIYQGCNVVGSGTLAEALASVGDGGDDDASFYTETLGSGGSSPVFAGANGGASGASADAGTGGGLGATGGNGATSGNGGGGCNASANDGGRSGVGLGAIAGVLALVVGRTLRARRRGAKAKG